MENWKSYYNCEFDDWNIFILYKDLKNYSSFHIKEFLNINSTVFSVELVLS